jgi:hypothetical protein
LRPGADGSVSPVAATVAMRFSGGGRSTLVDISTGAQQLTLSWPDALPRPVLHGSTATYHEVLPGIDLQVRAEVDRFATLVVVKNRAAAGNPALASLRFAVATAGVSIRTDPATGAVSAVDSHGHAVFTGGTPVMWDAGTVRPVAVTVQDGQLRVRPDAGMLADPHTVFPVVIDPTWGVGRSHWTLLRRSHPATAFWDVTSTAFDDGTNADFHAASSTLGLAGSGVW